MAAPCLGKRTGVRLFDGLILWWLLACSWVCLCVVCCLACLLAGWLVGWLLVLCVAAVSLAAFGLSVCPL